MSPYCYLENDTLTEIPSAETPGNDLDVPSWATMAFWRAGKMSPGFDFYDVLPTFIRQAESFVSSQDGNQPFFLYLPLAAPHTPWVPTDDFGSTSAAGQYGDFVNMVDAYVGRFLSHLEKEGFKDNTLVIFTSDNGPFWKPDFIERYDHKAAGNLRGMKADIWEGGHRIPFIVRWPGKVAAASESSQLTSLTNLMGTVSEIVEQPLGSGVGLDSQSVLAQMTGSPADPTVEVVHHSSRAYFALRSGSWKLIEGRGSGGFSQPSVITPEEGEAIGQLYNLEEDFGETNNLYQELLHLLAILIL